MVEEKQRTRRPNSGRFRQSPGPQLPDGIVSTGTAADAPEPAYSIRTEQAVRRQPAEQSSTDSNLPETVLPDLPGEPGKTSYRRSSPRGKPVADEATGNGPPNSAALTQRDAATPAGIDPEQGTILPELVILTLPGTGIKLPAWTIHGMKTPRPVRRLTRPAQTPARRLLSPSPAGKGRVRGLLFRRSGCA